MRPTGYATTYLDSEPFHARYKVAAKHLKGKTAGKTVLDLNCGTPGLCLYIEYGRYIGNDAYQPADIRGIEFMHCPDTEVDLPSDILCIFGYGGGEYTGQELESATAGDSLVRLAGYGPEYIVIEMAQEWEKRYRAMSNLLERLPGYAWDFGENLDIEPKQHYHDFRMVTILKAR